jgi:N-acetyl-gamma-glutamyl-phosphate reductase
MAMHMPPNAPLASGPSAGTLSTQTRVAIAGATGYAGQELVRLLARHPSVALTEAMSSGAASGPRPLPGLRGVWDGTVVPLDLDRLTDNADIVFLALPEAAAAEVGAALLQRNSRVIDLSGAFRLRDDVGRQRWYPATGALPSGVVYGLPERHAEAIRGARLVSCPGCYPTAALLALTPLAEAGLLQGGVVIDAKSGISGAGKAPSDRTHFSENHGSVSAYGVFAHRHTAEIEQEIGATVTFVPHLVPLDRGLLETIYGSLRPGTTEAQVSETLQRAYTAAPLVRLTGSELPEIKHVAYTNFCDIGWRVDEATNRVVIVSVIDNLLKGAAGQAVQNLNILLGLDERTGLL